VIPRCPRQLPAIRCLPGLLVLCLAPFVPGVGAAPTVAVSDAAISISIPSFRQQVEPILTRLGCNQGACHGKLAGQNGFKLSLRGYAPELDHGWLTRDVLGRRINPADPENSLLIAKTTGAVPHEGGVRIKVGDPYHRLLVNWIAARAPGPHSEVEEPDPSVLELLPGDQVAAPGDTRQLTARATWPDGATKDVTWLTQFFSNDDTTLTVTPDGLARAVRPGSTSIRAHFLGRVAVVRFTVPTSNRVEEWRYSRTQNAIDDAVFKRLAALQLPPSARCDDATFLRRAMLDTIGTLPTPEEVVTFQDDRNPTKRSHLVESLFERSEFTDYWTLQLADLLQNRKERDHDVRGTKGVRSFHRWLREQVAIHRPWNELVRTILTASGDTANEPAVGYFVTLYGEKPPVESEVTDAVAQGFLGTRIGCARCHNHPLERYTQDDFYHFAAFFGKTSLERVEPAAGFTTLSLQSRDERERQKRLQESERKLVEAQTRRLELASEDPKEIAERRKELGDRQREFAERKRELAEAHERQPVAWQPRTKRDLVARPLDRQAMTFDSGRDARELLANWVTSPTNAAFSGAMINRLWKHFFSVGLVEPVDDLRASNPPSNPELWDLLSREFVSSGFDLRQVMRLILNSRTYQLSSRTVPGNSSDRQFFSHYYARRLPAEVMQDALAAATGIPDRFEGHPLGLRAIQLPEPNVGSYFLSLFGRSERVTACACERSGDVTLPQLLHLQNGEETARKLKDDHGRLQELLRTESDRDRRVDQVYLATVARHPTNEERAHVNDILGPAPSSDAFADLYWALLNTKEFAFNH